MNRWDKKGVPHLGWTCTEVIDLGEGNGDETCSMCGQEEIRFVHVMSHPTYPEDERVGCICAGKMSGDLKGAKAREKIAKNKAARRKNWLTRKWRTSAAGNPFLNIEGVNLGVFKKNGLWGVRIGSSFGRRTFANLNEAKLHLFDAYWNSVVSKKQKNER